MPDGTRPGPRTEMLAKSLDSRSTFFQFGYQLRALEDAVERHSPAGARHPLPEPSDLHPLLGELRSIASRSSDLGPLAHEISDVRELLGARFEAGDPLPPELLDLLRSCTRRWYGAVSARSRAMNSLAMEIAFNLELAGLGDLSADLYEALLNLEGGAHRSCLLMCESALARALGRAGAGPAEPLPARLSRARERGFLTSQDVRQALACLGLGGRDGGWEAPEGPDAFEAETAVRAVLRLVKKLVSPELEKGLQEAAASFSATAKEARPYIPREPFPIPSTTATRPPGTPSRPGTAPTP